MIRQSAVVIMPTSNELPKTTRLDFDVKNVLKLSSVRLFPLSRNAFTRMRTSGITTKSRRKRMYGMENTFFVSFNF